MYACIHACSVHARTDAPADDGEEEPGREEQVDAVGEEADDAVGGLRGLRLCVVGAWMG